MTAPVLQKAVVAVEDARFYVHHGVDYKGLLRAVVHNGGGGSEQGASTLTEQYVKLTLLEAATTPAEKAAAVSRSSYQRKIREARIALALERRESKQQILQGYLNIAYFGEGAYGVDRAARRYFGIAPLALNLPQAALLAGLVNSPTRFDPVQHPQAAIDRRKIVLTRMRDQGLITQAQWLAADTSPLGVRKQSPTVSEDACALSSAPFFCDWIRGQLLTDPALGATSADRDQTLFGSGLTIRTTLDPTVQAAAQQAVDQVVPRSNHATAVMVVVQPGTGRVLAMAANRTYGDSHAPGYTHLGYLGYRPIFQGGSTFKIFTLLTALQQGQPLSTSFYAPACLKPDPALWDVPSSTTGPCPMGYQNSDPAEAATYNAVTGTWKSVNTFYIQLEQSIGIAPIISTAKSLGIRPAAFTGLSSRSLSLTLGAVNGVSPLEEATAYATLAAHGQLCEPFGLQTATDANNKPLPLATKQDCRQVIDPQLADTVTGVLRGVLEQPGSTAYGKAPTGRDAAGKTGTLNGEAAAWFVGYTAQLAAAVVIGDPNAPSRPLGTVAGVYPVYGGTLPAIIWQQAITQASADLPALALAPAIPDSGTQQPVPPTPTPSPITSPPPAPPTSTPAAVPTHPPTHPTKTPSSTPAPSPAPSAPHPSPASPSP